ncbi:MAG: hypothetical protein ACYCPS_04675 [Candidatus Saccharimonadales bacterium]
MNMELGTIVKNNGNGLIGVVAQDLMSCCTSEEEPIVYDGLDTSIGTDREQLEVIGKYDAPISDPRKCGYAAGVFCCRYLSCTPDGWACQRFSELRTSINMTDTNAQGNPQRLFPDCQEDIQQAIAASPDT